MCRTRLLTASPLFCGIVTDLPRLREHTKSPKFGLVSISLRTRLRYTGFIVTRGVADIVMAVRCFTRFSRFIGITDVGTQLKLLSSPEIKPTVEELGEFFRLHAQKLHTIEGRAMMQSAAFQRLHSLMQQQLPVFTSQTLSSYMFWLRSVSKLKLLGSYEVCEYAIRLDPLIQGYCEKGAFSNKQLVSMHFNATCINCKLAPIEQILIERLKDNKEIFVAETLRMVMHAIQNDPRLINKSLLRELLKRWTQLKEEESDISLKSKALSNLQVLKKFISDDFLDQAIAVHVNELLTQVHNLREIDLQILLSSMAVSRPPVKFSEAVIKHCMTAVPELSKRTRIALLKLATMEPYKHLYTAVSLLLQSFTEDVPIMNRQYFQWLLQSMKTMDQAQLPSDLMKIVGKRCSQSNTAMDVFLWSELTEEYPPVERVVSLLQNCDLYQRLFVWLAVHKRKGLPADLAAAVAQSNEIAAAEIAANTAESILLVLNAFKIPGVPKTNQNAIRQVVFDHCAGVLSMNVRRSLLLKFIYLSFNEMFSSCKLTLRMIKSANLYTGLDLFVKNLPVKDDLKRLARMLYTILPISVPILSDALKLDFDSIPEKFTAALLKANGKYLENNTFLHYHWRLFRCSNLSPLFLARIAKEIDYTVLSTPELLRVAAALQEKGALSLSQREKAEDSARLLPCSASNRILRAVYHRSPHGLEDLSDLVHLVIHKPSISAQEEQELLAPVLAHLQKFPVAHSVRIFDKYSVEDCRDSVTEALLGVLEQPAIESQAPETIVRFLRAAATVQKASPGAMWAAIHAVVPYFHMLEKSEKRSFIYSLGQLACSDLYIWTSVTKAINDSSQDFQDYQADLLRALHQSHLSNEKSALAIILRSLTHLLDYPDVFIGEEICNMVLALLPLSDQVLNEEARERLVQLADSFEKRGFQSYLLSNWLMKYPERAQYGSQEASLALAESVKQKAQALPACLKSVLRQESYAPAVLGGGFYAPFYIKRLNIALWPTNRAHSALNGRLIGDFVMLKLAAPNCLLATVPNRFMLTEESARNWYIMNPPEESTGEYEVERILNKAKVGPQVYYLVKWKGYEESESSWEPVSHMLRSCEMVTEYELDTAQEYRLVRGEHYWPPLKLKNLQEAETVERIGPEHWRCLPALRSLAQEPLSILSHYWTSPHLNQIRTIRFIVENSPDSYGAPRQSSVSLHELEQRVPKLLVEYLANHPLSSNYG